MCWPFQRQKGRPERTQSKAPFSNSAIVLGRAFWLWSSQSFAEPRWSLLALPSRSVVLMCSAATSDLVELSCCRLSFVGRLDLNGHVPDVETGTQLRLKRFKHGPVRDARLDGHVSRKGFHP